MALIDQIPSNKVKDSRSWSRALTGRVKAEPLSALILATIVATFIIFFGFVPLFIKGVYTAGLGSTAMWAWQAWTGEQAHSRLVLFVSLGLVIYHWKEIRDAPKRGANWGMGLVIVGIGLFVLSARCLQPRIALASLPFLTFGAV